MTGTGLLARIVVTCPHCTHRLRLTVDDVQVLDDGSILVGTEQAASALRLHQRYGCR